MMTEPIDEIDLEEEFNACKTYKDAIYVVFKTWLYGYQKEAREWMRQLKTQLDDEDNGLPKPGEKHYSRTIPTREQVDEAYNLIVTRRG